MPEADSNKLKSRRLDPAVRKHMILDKAAALIAAEGLGAASMERIGQEAGVSKTLVYAYFRNLSNLLQQLLLRDQRRLWEQQTIAVSQADNFEELIRYTTRTYLQHVEQNGIHIQRLMSEPSLAAVFQERERDGRQRVVDFLASEMARFCKVPRSVAILATEVSMGMTGMAGELVSRGVVGSKKIEEIVLCLFHGSAAALSAKYGKD